MGTLLEDIDQGAELALAIFRADKLNLDYSINSFIEIDIFFNKHISNGVVKGNRDFSNNLGATIFSIGAYVGNTLIKNVPGSIWVTDDEDPKGEINISVKFPNSGIIFPVQRVMQRYKNGEEDSIYVYGHQITKDFTNQEFDDSYWNKIKVKKPWWRFGK